MTWVKRPAGYGGGVSSYNPMAGMVNFELTGKGFFSGGLAATGVSGNDGFRLARERRHRGSDSLAHQTTRLETLSFAGKGIDIAAAR